MATVHSAPRNSNQGSQFTGKKWISELQKQGIQISLDWRGRWMDNIFIERLWRSLKYEKPRLWSYQTISELRILAADWIEFYNHRRKHQAHSYSTPWSVYQEAISLADLAFHPRIRSWEADGGRR